MRFYEIINEGVAQQISVFYGGRFQPIHAGHFSLYKKLVNKFGVDNVFISTMFGKKQQSMHAKADYSTDPFTFEEKSYIMTKMFGIPQNHIINTSPYRPDISLVGRNAEETAVVLAFSDKDRGRLTAGNVFQELPNDGTELTTVSDGTVYFVTMPVEQGGMSATDFRNAITSDMSPEEKKEVFIRFFGKYDEEIFNFIADRLS
jgi:cyanate lyase